MSTQMTDVDADAGSVRRAMTQQKPSSAPPPHGPPPGPQGDPWHAFGYIVSGVALYGFLGWLADRWVGTSFLVAIGILLGAALGIYQTFARFRQDAPSNNPGNNLSNDVDDRSNPDEKETR
ncbi:MAG: AtpZ/AtpI family protein [Nocardioidaceae bacterium]